MSVTGSWTGKGDALGAVVAQCFPLPRVLPGAHECGAVGGWGLTPGHWGLLRPLLCASHQRPVHCVLQQSLGTATTSQRWRTCWTRTVAPATWVPPVHTAPAMPTAAESPNAVPASVATRARSQCWVRTQCCVGLWSGSMACAGVGDKRVWLTWGSKLGREVPGVLLSSCWVLQALGVTTLCCGEAAGVWGGGQVGAEPCAGTKGMAVRRNQNCAELSEGLRVLSVVVSPPCPGSACPLWIMQISATCPQSVGTARRSSAASSSMPPASSARSSSTAAAAATGTTSRPRASASGPVPTSVTSNVLWSMGHRWRLLLAPLLMPCLSVPGAW